MFNIHKGRNNTQAGLKCLNINKINSSNQWSESVESDLRDCEEIYRTIFESANDALILIDKKGRVKDVNNKLMEISGYDKAELVGEHLTSLNNILPLKSSAAVTKNFAKIISGIQTPTYQVEMINKSGRLMQVEVNAVTLKKDGKIVGDLAILRDITEQKRTEETLRESEYRYRDLFEGTNDLIQSVSPEGKFRYVNDAWLKTLGYDKEEVAYLKISDIIHPDCQEHCDMLFRQLMAGKEIGSFETAFVSKVGGKVLVEGNVNCRFKDGKPVYTRGIFRNVTERKRIEEQMLRLAGAVWMSTDIIILTDLDSKIVDVNEAALKLLGVENKGSLIGKNFMTLVFPTWREKTLEDIHEVWKNGYSKYHEYHLVSNDGQEKKVEIKSSLARSSTGSPIGFVRVGSVINGDL